MSSSGRRSGGIHAGERRFALALTMPGILVLLLTTTFPLLYLIWSSFQTINLAMPFMDGFAGLVISILHSYYVFLKYAKLWELHAITTGGGDGS